MPIVGIDDDSGLLPLEHRYTAELCNPDFFRTSPMFLKEITPLKDTIFFNCNNCGKKNWRSVHANFVRLLPGKNLLLDGLGQQLRVKKTAIVIFQLMEIDEESFSAFPEDNSVEALLERCSEDRLFRSFVSSFLWEVP